MLFFKLETSGYNLDKTHCTTKKIEIAKVSEFLEEEFAITTQNQKPTFKNMFTNKYILRLRAVLFYQFFRQFTGSNYFAFYAVNIFDGIGQNGAMVNLSMSLAYVLGAVLSIWFVDALGRKTSIVSGVIAQAVALIGIVVMKMTESYGLLYPTCVLYVLGFILLAGPGTPWMVETIPSPGIEIAFGLQFFIIGLLGLFGPMMTDQWLGPIGTVAFFCFWGIVGVFVLDWVVIETKGKEMDEIEQEYSVLKYRLFRICEGRECSSRFGYL